MNTLPAILTMCLCVGAGAAEYHLFTTVDGKFSTRAEVVALDKQSLSRNNAVGELILAG